MIGVSRVEKGGDVARIVISTLGSSGDLNPFLALALGLRERGHDVLFAVEANFVPTLTEHGFATRLLPGNGEEALEPYTAQLFSSSLPARSVRLIVRHWLVPTLAAKIQALREACAGADLLVSAAINLAASAVADLTGIRWASVSLTPGSLPSGGVSPQPLPFALPDSVQHLVNRSQWFVGNAILAQIVDKPVNRVRAEFGLPPRHNLMTTGNLSGDLTAVAVSPAFAPPQLDWPSNIHVTGFCFWDTPGNWHEPPDLTDFLSQPSSVVVVSSGSMAPSVRLAFDLFYRTSIEAIRAAGARALVIGAAPGILPDPLPSDVYALPFAPFSTVYPRCAAAIHHGGIGTTAQALRAGIPAFVVPWGVDQFYSASQITHIGTGRYLLRRAYTVERAAAIIGALLHDPRYCARARDVAEQISREDGVATLAAALEDFMKISHRGTETPRQDKTDHERT